MQLKWGEKTHDLPVHDSRLRADDSSGVLCRKSLPTSTVGDLKCSMCGRMHPAEWYYAKGADAPGIDSRCKPCMAYRNYLRHNAMQLARETQEPIPEKPCRVCKKWLPRASFSNCASSKNGFSSRCKSCLVRYNMIRLVERKEYRRIQPAVAPKGKEQECYMCKVVKPWKDFSKVLNYNSGICTSCKECNALMRVQRL